MALIDVSDLLVDPDFVNTISLESRVPTVNSKGENTLAVTTATSVGSVQPISGAALKRLPEGLQVEKVSSFWYKGEIKIQGASVYPMVLIFNGRRYQIKQVFDWMNFGQGWCEGICVAEEPS